MEPRNPNSISTEKLVKSLSEKLGKVGKMSPKWCIYRVPKRLRQVNPDAYTPHLISIGPIHQEEAGLADMDEHKWWYTHSLLSRVEQTKPLEGPLRSCANAILPAEPEARDWYATSINLSDMDLARVLLLDGCFILELFFRYSERESSEKVQNDPVLRSEWMLSALRRDLALLENQIPFFVLKRLFYMVIEHNENLRADSLPRLAFNFFFGPIVIIPLPLMEAGGSHKIYEYKHLLDLLLKCHLPWPPRNRLTANKGKNAPIRLPIDTSMVTRAHSQGPMPSARSLIKAGGSIKKADSNNLFDIKFSYGELQIPTLHINEWTDSLFRNLIAFEHCCPENINTDRSEYMVSYIVLMDRLINTREDVELLMSKGIITVELGGSEDVTNFFKDICRQVTVKDFYFQELCQEVEKYNKSKIRGYLRDLKQTYLKNPWTIISLIAGLILLTCSAIQAGYTIKRETSTHQHSTSN